MAVAGLSGVKSVVSLRSLWTWMSHMRIESRTLAGNDTANTWKSRGAEDTDAAEHVCTSSQFQADVFSHCKCWPKISQLQLLFIPVSIKRMQSYKIHFYKKTDTFIDACGVYVWCLVVKHKFMFHVTVDSFLWNTTLVTSNQYHNIFWFLYIFKCLYIHICLLPLQDWKLLTKLNHPIFCMHCMQVDVCKTVIVIWLIRLHCGICHHPCIITSIIMLLLSSRAVHASSLPSPLLMTPVLSDSISVSVCGVQLHPSTDLFKRDSKGEIIYLHTLTWDCLADLMTGRDPVTLV